jgi:hypothetical protein
MLEKKADIEAIKINPVSRSKKREYLKQKRNITQQRNKIIQGHLVTRHSRDTAKKTNNPLSFIVTMICDMFNSPNNI